MSTATMPCPSIDDPERIQQIRDVLKRKRALRLWYEEVYRKYAACLAECPSDGLAIELGSGGGFVQELLPEVVTTDVLTYEGVDRRVDATQMPFEDQSLRAILMLNVFHHIPDVKAFFREARRCLKPGGRILIIDQHRGWISTPILRHMHHEPFDDTRQEWGFESTGPLSGANGALAWMVFQRDLFLFQKLHPEFQLRYYRPHSPLRYWLTGGLKRWNLLGSSTFRLASWLDRALVACSPAWGSFVDIELIHAPKGVSP